MGALKVYTENGWEQVQTGGTSAEIPTALPNPHKLTFSGAVDDEYDGSEPVEVVIPKGGGGASEEWELLADVTLEEAVRDLTVTLPTPCEHVIIKLYSPKTEGTVSSRTNSFVNGKSLVYYENAGIPSASASRQITYELRHLGGGMWSLNNYMSGDTNFRVDEFGLFNSNVNNGPIVGAISGDMSIQSVETVRFQQHAGEATGIFQIGTRLRVWGVAK